MTNKVRILAFDAYMDTNMMALEPTEINEKFLYVFICKTGLYKIADTSTIPQINNKHIEPYKISLPVRKEQEKIGDFFQQIDRLISQHQQKHDKLLNIKKALLEKMFPQPGKTEPEIRFKGFSGEWRTERLEENADFSKGQGYSKADLVESGSPIILYGRLYTKYETVIFKVDTFVIDNGKSIISKGIEVIVPASGETADDIAIASAVVVPRILLGGDLNIIYPDEKINSIFLALSISNGSPRKDLSRRAQGKSVVHVRNSDLKELNISYPDVNEQTKIGNLFQQLDRLISQHQTQIQKLNHLKQAFLSKMFV
jgi:type I restriction enzyme S subunit